MALYIPKRILFVDDQPGGVYPVMIESLKNDAVFTVVISGQLALAALLKGDIQFDCLRTDFRMPRMNGIQFLTTLREKYQEILRKLEWVIFKSSDTTPEMAVELGLVRQMRPDKQTRLMEASDECALWLKLLRRKEDPQEFCVDY